MSAENINCPKCLKVVHDNQESICCDSCDTWYHSKCSFLNRADFNLFIKNPDKIWFCKTCLREALPFQSLSENNFRDALVDQTKEIAYLCANPSSPLSSMDRKCSICIKLIRDIKTSVPCAICNSLIHRKCSGLQTRQLTNISRILREWSCSSCRKQTFPFSTIDDKELIALT